MKLAMNLRPRKGLCVLFLVSSSLPSIAARATAITASQVLGILERSSATCANSTFNQCSDSKLPDYFCCPADSDCISLDDSSSAICCPSTENCQTIEPISCDVALQNATAYPDSSVKTTRLEGTLPACGSSCCPFGYSCNNDLCILNTTTADTGSSSSTASSAATATLATITQNSATTAATTTSSSSSSASSSSSSAGDTSSISASSSNSNSSCTTTTCVAFPAKAVAAGFFPGMILGGLLTLLIFFCLGVRGTKSLKDLPPPAPSNSKTKHIRERSADGAIIGISDPIPSTSHQTFRTDFIRVNQRGSTSPTDEKGPGLKTRVRSLFSNNDTRPSTPPPALPTMAPYPVTPPSQTAKGTGTGTTGPPTSFKSPTSFSKPLTREPSTESIRVYSPLTILSKDLKKSKGSISRSHTTSQVQRILLTVPPIHEAQPQPQSQPQPTSQPSPPQPTTTQQSQQAQAKKQYHGLGLPLNPRPAENQRPNTTFTELMERAGLPSNITGGGGGGANGTYRVEGGEGGRI